MPCAIFSPFLISEHEPRKGTETVLRLPSSLLLSQDFRTRTPKGDGNAPIPCTLAKPHSPFQNTNPERGRKQPSSRSRPWHALHFRTRTPKGDGNKSGRRRRVSHSYFRTRTPKGDGNSYQFLHKYSIPAYFRTRTPKGDGNDSGIAPCIVRSAISEHEPRKGTETCVIQTVSVRQRLAFQNTNPERGRKHLLNLRAASDTYISEHEPRKGTETISCHAR